MSSPWGESGMILTTTTAVEGRPDAQYLGVV